MRIVSRSTEAVDYRHNGSTKVNLKGTDLSAQVSGQAKVEGKAGGVQIDASLDHFAPRTVSGWPI